MYFVGRELLAGCLLVEVTQEFGRGHSGARFPQQCKFVAAVADFNIKMLFNLAQVLAEKAAEIGKATAIVGLQRELD